jgi:hypothetical protein
VWAWAWQEIFRFNTKNTSHEGNKCWTSLKFKTSSLSNTLLKEWKDKPQTWRKYLQIKNFYTKSMKKSLNSTIRKQLSFKTGQISEPTTHQRRNTDGK